MSEQEGPSGGYSRAGAYTGAFGLVLICLGVFAGISAGALVNGMPLILCGLLTMILGTLIEIRQALVNRR